MIRALLILHAVLLFLAAVAGFFFLCGWLFGSYGGFAFIYGMLVMFALNYGASDGDR